MQLPVLALLIATAATLPCARGFGIVSASGGVFIEDGRRARFAGTNALSLAQFGDDFMRADVLSRMARANLTLLRLWAFNDGELCAPAPRQNFLTMLGRGNGARGGERDGSCSATRRSAGGGRPSGFARPFIPDEQLAELRRYCHVP
jgi:hypothetical protein